MLHIHEGSTLFFSCTLQMIFYQYKNPQSHHSVCVYGMLHVSMIDLFCSSSPQVFLYDFSLLYAFIITFVGFKPVQKIPANEFLQKIK